MTLPFDNEEAFRIIEAIGMGMNPEFTNPVNVIKSATKMFEGAKPMEGKELKILQQTYSRCLSDEPTKLI
jgi:hypothetical protein